MWRDIPGFENKYFIHITESLCECISNNYGRNKALSNKPLKSGYIIWNLSKNNIRVSHQAAVWVALTFPELTQNEYFEGAQIDHIDTNKLNNHPSNLRWVTARGNMNNPLTRKHLSSAAKGRIMTDSVREKLSNIAKERVGEKNYFYGKKHTTETKRKISRANKGRKHTDEEKRKMSEAIKGMFLNRPDQSIPILHYKTNGGVDRYPSIREAARQTKLPKTSITRWCNKERIPEDGSIWKFEKEAV